MKELPVMSCECIKAKMTGRMMHATEFPLHGKCPLRCMHASSAWAAYAVLASAVLDHAHQHYYTQLYHKVSDDGQQSQGASWSCAQQLFQHAQHHGNLQHPGITNLLRTS
jgi:hypothetical protein